MSPENERRPQGVPEGDRRLAGHSDPTQRLQPLPDPQRLHEAADRALAVGRYVLLDDTLILLPDVLVAEFVANGYAPLPPTSRLRRADGREVYVFLWGWDL